jgi:acyl carrier protein
MLLKIEKMLASELSHEEKKQAMDIRTINHICDYIESLAAARAASSE